MKKKQVTLFCFGPSHDKKNLQISLRHVCSLKMTLKVDREKMLKFAPQQAYLIFWESFIIFYIPKWDSFFLFYSLLLLALYQVWSRHQTVDDQNNVYFKKGSFWDLIIYSKLESDGLTIFFFISIDPPLHMLHSSFKWWSIEIH